MSRTNLKGLSDLRTALKFKSRQLADITAKYQSTARSGNNKPSEYSADQEYTDLFALGPIVTDLAEAVKAIEEELEHVHQYIDGAIGSSADETKLPKGGLKMENPRTNQQETVLAVDQSTGDVTLNADEVNFNNGTSIDTSADGSLNFNF